MKKRLMGKRAGLMQTIVINIILVVLIFALFYLSATNRTNSRHVKQQVVEKQIALLIDSAVPGVELIVNEKNDKNDNGKITNLEIKQGRVFAYIDGQGYSKGYPYFTQYSVEGVEKKDNKYIIKIK